MTAADSTSKGQFGWVELTTHHQTPASEGVAREDRVSTRLKYIDKSSIRQASEGEHSVGDTHATTSGEWKREHPRLWTEDDRRYGGDEEPILDESFGLTGMAQGTLFSAGEEYGPVLGSMASTRKGRIASAKGAGIMANLLERRSGTEMTGDTNLSSQSAPFVSKLTGVKQPVTNNIQFQEEPGLTTVPEAGKAERRTKELSDGTVRTTTHRWIPDEEAKAGSKRLTERMKAMRVNPMGKPPKDQPQERFAQQEMFGTLHTGNSPSPSATEHTRTIDKAGRESGWSSKAASSQESRQMQWQERNRERS